MPSFSILLAESHDAQKLVAKIERLAEYLRANQKELNEFQALLEKPASGDLVVRVGGRKGIFFQRMLNRTEDDECPSYTRAGRSLLINVFRMAAYMARDDDK